MFFLYTPRKQKVSIVTSAYYKCMYFKVHGFLPRVPSRHLVECKILIRQQLLKTIKQLMCNFILMLFSDMSMFCMVYMDGREIIFFRFFMSKRRKTFYIFALICHFCHSVVHISSHVCTLSLTSGICFQTSYFLIWKTIYNHK